MSKLQHKMTKPILGSVAVRTGWVASYSLQNEVLLTLSECWQNMKETCPSERAKC